MRIFSCKKQTSARPFKKMALRSDENSRDSAQARCFVVNSYTFSVGRCVYKSQLELLCKHEKLRAHHYMLSILKCCSSHGPCAHDNKYRY